MKRQITLGFIECDDVAIDVVIGLQYSLHLLFIDLKKRFFAHKFMALSSVHCCFAMVFLEL